ncbi:dihydrodipicolinate synthase family protein [Promicromonospora panici]|uniref:dihydrodipicolinate synthase family protein n=1 Tax=Promicromonospora panici TaxID=2219658 RepID=UPI00101DB2BD|nr:dihydrodipicolinate synthase family protein [Promicromonospora panici]
MLTGTPLLTGLTVPLVTPMELGGRPSAERSARLLDALYAGGVRTLMLLGSNGEGPLVPASGVGPFTAGVIRRWRELGKAAIGHYDGIVTVNVTAAGTQDVLERAEAAAAAGADALVLSPPIYFHHRSDEIVAHYAAVADVGLPVVAYNAPRYSNPITPGIADALADLDHVVGIKDSSGDLTLLEHLVGIADRRPGFAVGQGAETLLAAGLGLGAHGIVPGVANIAPGLALALLAAHDAGDAPEVARLQQVLTDLTGLHKVRPGTPAIKAVLARRGLCPPHVAPPLLACDPAERNALHVFLAPFEGYLL